MACGPGQLLETKQDIVQPLCDDTQCPTGAAKPPVQARLQGAWGLGSLGASDCPLLLPLWAG